MTPAVRRWAVVPAAGHGARFESTVPKQYASLRGRPVLSWSLRALLAEPSIRGVFVALREDDDRWASLEEASDPRVHACRGGATRERSVGNALDALAAHADATDWVLVHDAARPCLTGEDLATLFAELDGDPVGGLLAVPVADTLKRGDDGGLAQETVERDGLWRALTPQMFRYGLLRRALALCAERGRAVTDEASAIECLGLRPRLVRGRVDNLKITNPEDAALAEAILGARAWRDRAKEPFMRVGTGYDVHAFGEGDHVVLGGVRIPHDRGVIAHSDGDVALHALCDALLGAMGLGDIGGHFPDSDPRWKGADSRRFLRHCGSLLLERGWHVVNADLTLLAQAPRIGAHREQMRRNIADDLGVPADRVNVKATTTEGLGALGRREGLACQAIVLLSAGEDAPPRDGR